MTRGEAKRIARKCDGRYSGKHVYIFVDCMTTVYLDACEEIGVCGLGAYNLYPERVARIDEAKARLNSALADARAAGILPQEGEGKGR